MYAYVMSLSFVKFILHISSSSSCIRSVADIDDHGSPVISAFSPSDEIGGGADCAERELTL